ncbi:MAG: BspA family leucine-rich repeat surface protein [Clostridiales bacterium]|nr:BspA family leucine-rich repeat surface protein [Clostridiales bacterium]
MSNQVSSKKFKTTVISMCLGFLMVVGAVIGVWAATTQNYKAGFNVSYSVGDNVAAKVRTEYYVPNQDSDGDGKEDGAITVTTNEAGNDVEHDGNGYITFNSSDESTEKEVYIGNIKLTPQTPKVYFYFTIHNLIETDGNFIQVIVNGNYETRNNVTVKTTYLNTESFALSSSASIMSADDYVNKQYDNVSGLGVKIICFELSVIDINKQATIEGDIALGLYFSEAEQSVSTLSKTALRNNFWYYLEGYGAGTVLEEDKVGDLIFDYAQNNPSLAKTGPDVSDAGDGSIWVVKNDGKTYILSEGTICLPADSSYLFECSMEFDADYGNLYDDSPYIIEQGYYPHMTSLIFKNLNTSSVEEMSSMFSECKLTSLDLSSFDTSNVTDMSGMFLNCESLASLDLSDWDTSSVTNISSMFSGCNSLRSINVSNFDTSCATDMSRMFWNCKRLASLDLSDWDTSNVTNMSGMFSSCDAIKSLDLSSFDTSNVTDMSSMFWNCESLTSLDLSEWDTSRVTDMSGMFNQCFKLLSLDISSFNTSFVIDMSLMFRSCYAITSLDISSFDTSRVIDMSFMFNGCKSLASIDVVNFDTSRVTDIANMFAGCESLTSIDVSNFDTSNVTNMSYMFGKCDVLTVLDLSGFSTSNVKDMSYMFYNSSNLTTIYVGSAWSTAKVSISEYMFTNCTSLVGAVAYNSSKTDKSMANYTTGYLTLK